MSFKYINPGYVSLLDETDTAITQILNPPSSKTKTGVCYTYFHEPLYEYGTLLTDKIKRVILLDEFNSDIWVKFDYYVESSVDESSGDENSDDDYNTNYEEVSGKLLILLPYNFCMEFTIYLTDFQNEYNIYLDLNTSPVQSNMTTSPEELESVSGWKRNAINNFLIHAHYNTSSEKESGTIEVSINGKPYASYEQTVDQYSSDWSGSDTNYIKISSNFTCYFSNLIISNTEISADEKIISLPILETNSTMSTLEGGIYVADKVGQKLLQSVDVTAVADIYGDDAPLTGFLLIGDPAYTDSDTGHLTAISKIGSETTEHGTFEVNTDSDVAVHTSWIADSNTTIADLNGVWFGWKASD